MTAVIVPTSSASPTSDNLLAPHEVPVSVEDLSPCAICLDPLCQQPVSVPFLRLTNVRSCSHIIHTKCLENWGVNKFCPCCRGTFDRILDVPDPAVNYSAWFGIVDADCDKIVSKEDVMAMLKAQYPLSAVEAEKVVDRYWPNQSETLEEKELIETGLIKYLKINFPRPPQVPLTDHQQVQDQLERKFEDKETNALIKRATCLRVASLCTIFFFLVLILVFLRLAGTGLLTFSTTKDPDSSNYNNPSATPAMAAYIINQCASTLRGGGAGYLNGQVNDYNSVTFFTPAYLDVLNPNTLKWIIQPQNDDAGGVIILDSSKQFLWIPYYEGGFDSAIVNFAGFYNSHLSRWTIQYIPTGTGEVTFHLGMGPTNTVFSASVDATGRVVNDGSAVYLEAVGHTIVWTSSNSTTNAACRVWKTSCGLSIIVISLYTAVSSVIFGFIFCWRTLILWRMRIKTPKIWEASGTIHLALSLVCLLSLLTSLDVDGYRGIVLKPVADLFWGLRFALLYWAALSILLQWVSILNSKGNTVVTSSIHIYILRAVAILLFLANGVIPLLVTSFQPPGAKKFALYNVTLEYFENGINAFVAISGSIGSIVYGGRLYSAVKFIRNNNGADTKVSIGAGNQNVNILFENNQSKGIRKQNLRRVLRNIIVLSTILFVAGLNCISLIISELGYCYHYDRVPPVSYWFSVSNSCAVVAPLVCLLIMGLPGEKSIYTRVTERIKIGYCWNSKIGVTSLNPVDEDSKSVSQHNKNLNSSKKIQSSNNEISAPTATGSHKHEERRYGDQ